MFYQRAYRVNRFKIYYYSLTNDISVPILVQSFNQLYVETQIRNPMTLF